MYLIKDVPLAAAGFVSSEGAPPFAAANISLDCEGKEGSCMKLLHHSHSTNGVRPSGPYMTYLLSRRA